MRDVNKPLELSFYMFLIQLIDISVVDNSMLSLIEMKYEWRDEQLQWHPAMFGNLTSIRVSADIMWKPDIIMWNSISDGFNTYYDVDIIITHNGTINWFPPGLMRTSCSVQTRQYPFEKQSCEFMFGSWTHTKETVTIKHIDPVFNENGDAHAMIKSSDSYHYESTEWNVMLEESTGVVTENTYPCCPGQVYQTALFHIVAYRDRRGPVITVMLPCLLTSILAILTFFVPPSAGEKIGLSKLI